MNNVRGEHEYIRQVPKAITRYGGFMGLFQEQNTGSFPMPDMLSRFMQVPVIYKKMRKNED